MQIDDSELDPVVRGLLNNPETRQNLEKMAEIATGKATPIIGSNTVHPHEEKKRAMEALISQMGYDVRSDYGIKRIDSDIKKMSLQTINNYISTCERTVYDEVLSTSSSGITKNLVSSAWTLLDKLKAARENHPETLQKKKDEEAEKQHKLEQTKRWASQGLCTDDGGKYAGFLVQKCSICNRSRTTPSGKAIGGLFISAVVVCLVYLFFFSDLGLLDGIGIQWWLYSRDTIGFGTYRIDMYFPMSHQGLSLILRNGEGSFFSVLIDFLAMSIKPYVPLVAGAVITSFVCVRLRLGFNSIMAKMIAILYGLAFASILLWMFVNPSNFISENVWLSGYVSTTANLSRTAQEISFSNMMMAMYMPVVVLSFFMVIVLALCSYDSLVALASSAIAAGVGFVGIPILGLVTNSFINFAGVQSNFPGFPGYMPGVPDFPIGRFFTVGTIIAAIGVALALLLGWCCTKVLSAIFRLHI